MESKTYMEDIQKSFKDLITKKINYKSTVINGAVTVIAAIVLTTAAASEGEPSAWRMAAFIMGFAGIVWGLSGIAFRRRHYVYIPTASPVRKTSIHLTGKHRGPLTGMLGKAEEENGKVTPEMDLSGARLEVWRSRDGNFAAIQLFRYRPHEFYAVSPVIRAKEKDMDSLLEFMRRNG